MNWQDKRINELEKEIDKINPLNKQKGVKMKQYVIDVKGIVILDDEWNNTQITITRNGICDTIEFDKSDIVKTEEQED